MLHCSNFNQLGPSQPSWGEIVLVRLVRPSLLAKVSLASTNSDRVSAAVNHDAKCTVAKVRDSKAYGGMSGGLAGILYKWMN